RVSRFRSDSAEQNQHFRLDRVFKRPVHALAEFAVAGAQLFRRDADPLDRSIQFERHHGMPRLMISGGDELRVGLCGHTANGATGRENATLYTPRLRLSDAPGPLPGCRAGDIFLTSSR